MSEFPPGFSFVLDGQIYTPIRTLPYTRKDESPTTLIEWATSCAGCGDPIRVRTSLRFEWPSRRCTACKAPGAAVRDASRRTSSGAKGAKR